MDGKSLDLYDSSFLWMEFGLSLEDQCWRDAHQAYSTQRASVPWSTEQ